MVNFQRLLTIASICLVIGTSSSSVFAAPTAVESILELNAYSYLGDINSTDNFTDSQTSTINPLNGSVLSVASNGSSSYSTSLNVTSTWNDISSGSVIFDGRIIADNFPDGPAGLGSYVTAGPSIWTYSFIPDTDGEFSFAFDTYGAQINNHNGSTVFESDFIGFQYYYNDNSSWRTLHATDPNPLTFDITAGVPFEVGFGWVRETVGMGGIGGLTLISQGTFDWSFDTAPVVPEPISSTLFIVGGATLGFRRFWRKRKMS